MKKFGNTTIYKHIGNFFIILSLIGFAYTFYPLVPAYLPSPLPQMIDKKSSLVIPKINAYAPIILSVDPWDEKIYKEALKQGVAHAKGTSAPGEKGLTYLFAHSSGNPWELTRYNTVFLRLGELEKGDSITVYRNGKEYIYVVNEKKEVWPSDVSHLVENKDSNILILQTCTPIGTDLKRLLVFARPKE